MQIIKNPAYWLKIQEKRITSPRASVRKDALQKLMVFSYGSTAEIDPYDFYSVKLVNTGRKLVAKHYNSIM
jgi:hypothetical protein